MAGQNVSPGSMPIASMLNATAGRTATGTSMASTAVSRNAGLKHDVRKALESIEAPGSFAAGGPLPTQPPAAISVPGIGDIQIPLEEAQAKELIAKSRQAPYGKGAETIVDTSVRNTWELDASQFTFKDPDWDTFLAGLCARVAGNLGIRHKIKADIYKMLIYEKGAMFKAHTDTEKISGMFGTLVISLPSEHDGGDIVLKHCGMQKVLKTSNAPYSYACWYSDVTHEILPVMSGYRWVLTFNLAPRSSEMQEERPTAGLQQLEAQQLRQALHRWLELSPSQRAHRQLYHVFDHDYTEASISFKALKGLDLARVKVLQEVSSGLPFEIFFALLEKEKSEDIDDGYDNYCRYMEERDDDLEDDDDDGYFKSGDVIDETYSIKTLKDLRGNIVMTDIGFNKQCLLDEECFDDMEPDDEHQGYAGNEGGTSQYWYRLTALVIVPRDSVSSFLAHEPGRYTGYGNTQTLVRYWAQKSRNAPSNELLIRLMDDLCDKAWSTWKEQADKPYGITNPPISGNSMQEVMVTAIQLKRFDLFEKYAARHQAILPLDFFDWVRTHIGIGERDDQDLLETFDCLKQGLHRAVFHFGSLDLQSQAIAKLVPRSDSRPLPLPIMSWARETATSCVDARYSKRLLAEDGPSLINLSLYVDDPVDFLSNTVSKIAGRADAPAFFFKFLARLREDTVKGILPSETSTSLYKTTAQTFIKNLELPGLHTVSGQRENEPKQPRYSFNHHNRTLDHRHIVSPDDVISFASTLLSMSGPEQGDDDLMGSLVSKLTDDAPILPSGEFHYLWNPFLRSLAPILAQNSIPLDTPRYQSMYSSMLNVYVDMYVGREPGVDKSLVRNPVACRCRDCNPLNAFLARPDQKLGNFPLAEKRRRHLHEKLDAANVDCTHETLRAGSPYTLVVTKTFKQNQYARSSWQTRQAEADRQLGRFKQHDLTLLLGQEGYKRVTGMRHLLASSSKSRERSARAPAATTRPAVLGVSSTVNRQIFPPAPQGGMPPAVAGVKRQYPGAEDVIDLTSD